MTVFQFIPELKSQVLNKLYFLVQTSLVCSEHKKE